MGIKYGTTLHEQTTYHITNLQEQSGRRPRILVPGTSFPSDGLTHQQTCTLLISFWHWIFSNCPFESQFISLLPNNASAVIDE